MAKNLSIHPWKQWWEREKEDPWPFWEGLSLGTTLGLRPGIFLVVLNGWQRIWDDGAFFGFTPWKIQILNLKMEVDSSDEFPSNN